MAYLRDCKASAIEVDFGAAAVGQKGRHQPDDERLLYGPSESGGPKDGEDQKTKGNQESVQKVKPKSVTYTGFPPTQLADSILSVETRTFIRGSAN